VRPTTVPPWLLLALAVAGEVLGTLCLRASAGFTRPLPALGVLAAYGVSLPLFARALSGGLGLGVAYGTLTACGLAAAALLGVLVFGEPLTATQGAGLALLAAGTVVMTRRRA
jgi:small multidrug resistance pump